MSSVPQLTVTTRAERQEAREHKRHFEDEAANIIESHISQLEVHRRSVLLFYLVFGLLVGFFLGLAGAKGVLASTFDTGSPIGMARHQPVMAAGAFALPEAAAEFQLPDDLSARVLQEPHHQKRYAAIRVFGTFANGDAMAVAPSQSPSNKGPYMGLLAVVLIITASLMLSFWRHLKRAYAPRRRAAVEWAPRHSRRR